MSNDTIYEGIDNDPLGAMNQTGNIIRDAWVFALIPETETCKGWSKGRLSDLYDQVHKAWQPYGHMVSGLPPELMQRHKRIYDAAFKEARSKGWDPDGDLEGES